MIGWRLWLVVAALLALAAVMEVGCILLAGSGAPIWTGRI